MRPLTAAVAAAGRGRFVLDGVARMRERPIQDLVDGLVQLGVDATCSLGTGCPPVVVNAAGLPSGKVREGEGGRAEGGGDGQGWCKHRTCASNHTAYRQGTGRLSQCYVFEASLLLLSRLWLWYARVGLSMCSSRRSPGEKVTAETVLASPVCYHKLLLQFWRQLSSLQAHYIC